MSGNLLSNGYCPGCGFPLYQLDRCCGGCGAAVPPAPPGSRPLAVASLGRREARRTCPACGLVTPPNRTYCTRCGAPMGPVQPARPPSRPGRRAKNPALSVSLFVLVVQILVLAALWWAYSRDPSTVNLVFVSGVALSGVLNLVRALSLLPRGIRQGRGRRSRKGQL